MDLRKFPRREVCTQQRVFSFSVQKEPTSNVVLSRNVSASGFCYKSSKPCRPGEDFLAYFDDNLLEDLKVNKAHVLKTGKYFMARVIWCKMQASHQALPVASAGVRGVCEARSHQPKADGEHWIGPPIAIDLSNPYYEIGCAFVGLDEGDDGKLELFTSLINQDTARRLGVNEWAEGR